MGLRSSWCWTSTWMWVSSLVACQPSEAEPGCIGSCETTDQGSSSGAADDTPEASSSGDGSGGVARVPGATAPDDAATGTQAEGPPGNGPCAELGDACVHEGDCCLHPEGAAVCVAEPHGASCHAGCASDEDCDSGCCVPLHGGSRACMETEQCAHDCAPLAAQCTADADCCAGSSCVGERCTVACAGNQDCPSGCCGEDSQCAEAASCGGSDACDDATHFCWLGTTNFVCDDDAWYAVDCEAACVSSGHAASSGCGWSDLYEDDVCLCTDQRAT